MPLLRSRPARAAAFLALTEGVIPTRAMAHAGEPLAPHDLWTAWSLEPFVLVPMLLSAILYTRGVARLRRTGAPEYQRGSNRIRAFVTGWIWLAVALVSPVDALGGVLFSGHMLQHEILMLLGAPLLVVGRPFVPFLWGLPAGWGRSAGPLLRAPSARRAWRLLTLPLVAWSLHGLALWVWHVPALFEATVVDDVVHAAQHASFLGTALIFWWALLEEGAGAAGYGMGLLYVFTTAVHSSILGALLTFAPTVWYPVYSATTAVWGLTALEDQQLGGLIMWVPGGIVYGLCGLFLFARWIQNTPRPRPGRQASRGATMPVVLLALMAGAVLLGGCTRTGQEQAALITGGDPGRGREVIRHYGCQSCHTIPGVRGADALVGPPLTRIGTRAYLAGELPNTPANMMSWVQHPRRINPRTAMPDTGVTDDDVRHIAAYLYTLK